MMGRDDVAVGVGGEGGILPNGTILPNVGGYLPIIEQVYMYYVECGSFLFKVVNLQVVRNAWSTEDIIYG